LTEKRLRGKKKLRMPLSNFGEAGMTQGQEPIIKLVALGDDHLNEAEN